MSNQPKTRGIYQIFFGEKGKQDADPEEIKKKYRDWAKEKHPERTSSERDKEYFGRVITPIYGIIGNFRKAEMYRRLKTEPSKTREEKNLAEEVRRIQEADQAYEPFRMAEKREQWWKERKESAKTETLDKNQRRDFPSENETPGGETKG